MSDESDGCTGFQWLEGWFTGIRACCVDHDNGSSHGALLDCILANTPAWAHGPAAFCVALMVLVFPLYRWAKVFFRAR